MSAVHIYATVREAVTLLRGPKARKAAEMTALHAGDVLWSHAGKGFTIPTAQLEDVSAYCQAHYWLMIVKDTRKRVTT